MKKISIIVTVLLLFSAAGLYRTRALQVQDQARAQKVNKEAEREAARRIRKGLGGERKTIPEAVLETKTDLVKRLEVGLPVLTPNSPFNAQTYLAERACAADAIFIGVVKDKKSQLTDDQTFVFSDYQIVVKTILKNESIPALSSSAIVDVLRLGGDIEIHGRRVEAISEAAQPLTIGKRYLLFVTFLPETNTFAANNLAFLITEHGIEKLSAEAEATLLVSGKDAAGFIDQVREAATSQCKTQGGV